VVILACLLTLTGSVSIGREAALLAYDDDPRLAALQEFFESFDSPAGELSEHFLAAADRHGLDWRLLPCISIIESGGGKACVNNNILGWNSCRRRFPSAQAGIETVASRLANSNLYKGKDLEEKLQTYNPHPGYPVRVMTLMRQLRPGQTSASMPD